MPARVLLASVAVAAGCGSGAELDTATNVSSGAAEMIAKGDECAAEWNGPTNEANRERLVAAGYEVGAASPWIAEGDAGPAGEGCGYLFHDDESFISFDSVWEGDVLVWSPDEPMTDSWSPEQERGGHSSTHLVADDGTISLDPDWQPTEG